MTGSVETMVFEERIERLKALAASLLEVLRKYGVMPIADALSAVASAMKVALSQAKYALTFARSNGMVKVDDLADTVAAV